MVALEAGQQLQHSYTYTLDGTSQRQFHLKTGKYFTCKCDRCSDPTELGTNFSTLKCNSCNDGWLLPEKPIGKHIILVLFYDIIKYIKNTIKNNYFRN